MAKKYRRCKTCKQLISIRHENCPNCANKNPLNGFVPVCHGQSGKPTLDIQEGNWDE